VLIEVWRRHYTPSGRTAVWATSRQPRKRRHNALTINLDHPVGNAHPSHRTSRIPSIWQGHPQPRSFDKPGAVRTKRPRFSRSLSMTISGRRVPRRGRHLPLPSRHGCCRPSA
jgi:hypothetical protein